MISLFAAIALILPTPAVRVAETVPVGPDTTAQAALVAPTGSRCPQWYDTAMTVGWDPDTWLHLDRIMWCESRCDPAAHNRSGAAGLEQIMPVHWHGRDPYDPATNLTMALEVFHAQGWPAWSCN